jgi:MATE family multidrug resistance protein
MGLAGICFFVFRESIMKFWSSDPEVISVGMSILVCAAIFQIFDAASIIYNGALRGAGDTMWLASVTAIGALGILGIGGFLMIKLFPDLGAIGPWIAATVYVISVGIANRWRFKSKRWAKIDLFKAQQVDLPGEIGSVVE